MKLRFTYEYKNLLIFVFGLLIILYMYARRKKKKRMMKFGNLDVLRKVSEQPIIDAGKILFILHLLAVSSILIGISDPVIIHKTNSTDSDIVIAVDSSASMFTQDIKPSRFKAAKTTVKDFLGSLGNSSKTGLVSYSGSASKITDSLMDAERTVGMVDDISMGSVGGTAIGEALMTSNALLMESNKEKDKKKIILVTDGENNAGVSINKSIESLEQHGVSVYPIGIGSTSEDASQDYGMVQGNNASKAEYPNINRRQLQRIAERTGGNAVFVTDAEGLKEAFSLQKTTDEKTKDISNYFGIAGVFFLVLEWFIRTTNISPIP